MVVRFAALMAVVAVLASCGQKGPLYLPDKGGEVVTRPGGGQPQQQAPTSQPPGSPPTGTTGTTPDQPDEQKKNQQTPRN